MSMRHHWHELDELLAQIDREARFKRGPFRPGLKILGDAAEALQPASAEIADASGSSNVLPLRPAKPPEAS